MTNKQKRIALTVPPELKADLDRTAKLLGVTTTSFIIDILEESQPTVRQIGDAVEAAKNNPVDALEIMKKATVDGRQVVADAQVDLEDAIASEKRRRKHK